MILERDKKPAPPYIHQDYPGVRYKLAGEKAEHLKVNDALEDAAAEARGFTSDVPAAGIELILAPYAAPVKPKPSAAKK